MKNIKRNLIMKKAKFQYVELFRSIEGEAKYSGWPTIYVRFTKCNFKCKGFNNPNNVDPSSPQVLQFDPTQINSLQEIKPDISIGCDSIYAWDNQFKHLWQNATAKELADQLTQLVPQNLTWDDMILSLTGGEPTLQMKTLPELLNQPQFEQLKYVLIETNGSVPLRYEDVKRLQLWAALVPGRKIIWSNSPKLSISGEPWDKAIRPDVIATQYQPFISSPELVDQYFKFVCDDSDQAFDEVQDVLTCYQENNINTNHNVYIMPMACTKNQQQNIAEKVAEKCIERGWIYCHRVHNDVYDNSIGK